LRDNVSVSSDAIYRLSILDEKKERPRRLAALIWLIADQSLKLEPDADLPFATG
jgi:hypothetical protein